MSGRIRDRRVCATCRKVWGVNVVTGKMVEHGRSPTNTKGCAGSYQAPLSGRALLDWRREQDLS